MFLTASTFWAFDTAVNTEEPLADLTATEASKAAMLEPTCIELGATWQPKQ
jgi:hypothetical protein